MTMVKSSIIKYILRKIGLNYFEDQIIENNKNSFYVKLKPITNKVLVDVLEDTLYEFKKENAYILNYLDLYFEDNNTTFHDFIKLKLKFLFKENDDLDKIYTLLKISD